MDRVTLRSENTDDDLRSLAAHRLDDGGLRITGHDLGKGVEEFFGEGNREYEWTWTIKAGDVPLLVAALGGVPGDSVLALLGRTCSGDGAVQLNRLLGPGKAVPAEFWSRVGS